jgi:hypothetical protein
MIELLPVSGTLLVARRSPGMLTVLALKDGVLVLARSLELSPEHPDTLEEISSDLYPTLAYIEDHSGTRPEKLILAGFGAESGTCGTRLSVELQIPVEDLAAAWPGLAGYLASFSGKARKAAA